MSRRSRASCCCANGPNAGAAQLPLKRGLKLAIVGPNGNQSGVFSGLYHGANYADFAANATGRERNIDASCLPTAFETIAKENAGGTTTFACGRSDDSHRESWGGHMSGPQSCSQLVGLSNVNATIAGADVVLLLLGLEVEITGQEGTDRAHTEAGYALPGMQAELARVVAAHKKPTVVIMVSGMAVGMDF